MAPRYPHPTRQDPPQAGKFMEQANPVLMPNDGQEGNVRGQNLPEFNAEDMHFLAEIRVRT